MINDVRFKVCGLRSAEDAAAAASRGADYLGFIFHPKSPRAITLDQYAALEDRLPRVPRVAVVVEPSAAGLRELLDFNFDQFQVHFGAEVPLATLTEWSALAGRGRLWLAPKLPPTEEVKPEWLSLADTFLLDTFHPDKFGGTGETGDWVKFKRHRATHTNTAWILSGGLNPENIAAAVAASDAKFVDVNSGVEDSPGVKSREKLKAFARALHEATKRGNTGNK
jgi:phosphoribosylanthranilate isomerase